MYPYLQPTESERCEMTYELEDLGLHGEQIPQQRKLAEVVSTNGSLKDLNLDSELYAAYVGAKNFLAELQNTEPGIVAPNHVAQVFNTISAILKEIVKMQTDLYNAERLKRLEAAMISAIKTAPPEAQQVFLEQYQSILKEHE